MIFLKSLIFSFFLFFFTLIYAIICIIVFPFLSYKERYNLAIKWNKSIIFICKIVCNIKYKIYGLNHLEFIKDKKVIILSKHQSIWETIAFMIIFPKQLCFVFKKELLWIPFFGWILYFLQMICIDRSNKILSSRILIKQGKKHLNSGKWIVIFPEGTRTISEENKKTLYHKGGVHLAQNTQSWILPVAHNAGQCWPKNSFLKYSGTITVSIGPAISSFKRNLNDLNHEIQDWIELEMKKIN